MLLSQYRVTREYGGPEEGGWWYDRYTFERVHLRGSPKRHQKPKSREASFYTKAGKEVTVGRCSVLGDEGDVVFLWEKRAGERATKYRPHYE